MRDVLRRKVSQSGMEKEIEIAREREREKGRKGVAKGLNLPLRRWRPDPSKRAGNIFERWSVSTVNTKEDKCSRNERAGGLAFDRINRKERRKNQMIFTDRDFTLCPSALSSSR